MSEIVQNTIKETPVNLSKEWLKRMQCHGSGEPCQESEPYRFLMLSALHKVNL